MLTIRQAVPSDADAIAEVHVAAWKMAYKGCFPDEVLNNLNMSEFVDRWRKTLEDSSCQVAVAVRSNMVFGFVCFTATPNAEKGSPEVGEILSIYLHPRHWRGGIGTTLAMRALDTLRSHGCTRCVLWVLAENTRARAFYEQKLGMHPSGKTQPSYMLGVAATVVQYYKDLS